MQSTQTVDQFLSLHKYDKSKHPFISHTRIGDKDNGIFGGSYYISKEHMNTFNKVYHTDVFLKCKPEYLTEKQDSKTGLMYVDLDFNYAELGRHHNTETVNNIIDNYLIVLKEYLYFDEDTDFNIYVMERDKPYFNGKKNKDGLHIIFCLDINRDIQLAIRNHVMKEVDLSDLPLINSIEDVFDEGITKGSVNLQLFGSRKPNCDPYKIVTRINVKYDDNDGEFITDYSNNIEVSVDLLKEVSAYENKTILSPLVCSQYFHLLKPNESKQTQPTSPRSVTTEVYSEEYQTNAKLFDKALDNGMLYKLSDSSGMPWREVGLKIKSVFGDNEIAWILFDKFCRLSKNKYGGIDNQAIWDGFKASDDYNNFGIIVNMLKADNADLYYEIKKEFDSLAMKPALDNMILELQKSEEELNTKIINNKYFISIDDLDDPYKVSTIISQTLKDTLKLCNENWYMLTDSNLWKQQKEPSFYIIGELRKYIDESNKKVVLRISQLDGESKDKQIEISKKYLKAYKSISGTGFLNVLTKFLKTLLSDDQFSDKLDNGLYRMVYKNGILDLKTMKFKNSINPEDYITKTIPFDYIIPNEKDVSDIKENIKKICNYNDSHLEYYLSTLGYAFTGDSAKEQSFWYLRGQTAENGKSIIFEALEKLMPNYVLKANSDFMDKGADIRKEVATWRGLKLLWLNEVSSKSKDEDLVKALCDGTGYKYNRLYSTEAVVMNISFKLFAVSNNTLNIKGDAGVKRRFKLEQFNSQFKDEFDCDYINLQFKKDKSFGEKLCGEYKDALIYLILTYANQYWNEKQLKAYPVEWHEETNEVMADNNKFEEWFYDNFEVGEDNCIQKGEFESILNNSNYKSIKIKDEFARMKMKFKYDSQRRGCVNGKRIKGFWVGFKKISQSYDNIEYEYE